MMKYLYLLLSFIPIINGNKVKNECEKRVHSSFSPKQRIELCEHSFEQYSLGPAACSVMAKDTLHLPIVDILRLCKEAESTAPAECFAKLEQNKRKAIGFNLCPHALSALPADCYTRVKQLLSRHGASTKVSDDDIVSVCASIVDRAPILCIQAAFNQSLHTSPHKVPIQSILTSCRQAVGSGQGSVATVASLSRADQIDALTANCINELAPMKSLSGGEVMLTFCSEINARYFDPAGSWWQAQSADTEDEHPFLTAAVDCVKEGLKHRHHSPVSGLLSLCRNAPIGLGPLNCSEQVLSYAGSKGKGSSSQQDKDSLVVALCRHAEGTGPAQCYQEWMTRPPTIPGSSGSGHNKKEQMLIDLCHSARGPGPAMCYRRAAAIFRHEAASLSAPSASSLTALTTIHEEKLSLCLHATSEAPADCALAAPHYLSSEEKIHLCARALPAQGATAPSACLAAIQPYMKRFTHGGPERALGYFQENLLRAEDWTSRALLVSLCSSSDSHDPLAAAECYKSAASSLGASIPHDEAARLCTNASSAEIVATVGLCSRLLPRHLQAYLSPAELCSQQELTQTQQGNQQRGQSQQGQQRSQAEVIVKCAVDGWHRLGLAVSYGSSSGNGPATNSFVSNTGFSPVHLTSVCATETDNSTGGGGPVLSCLLEVHRLFSMYRSSVAAMTLFTAQTIQSLCQQQQQQPELPTTSAATSSPATQLTPAACLSRVLSELVSGRHSIDPDVIPSLCHATAESAALITCLAMPGLDQSTGQHQPASRRMITLADLSRCQHRKIELHKAVVTRLWSIEDNSIHVTAGRRFSLSIQLYDQWGGLYINQPSAVYCNVAINENNPQGAVLWGSRGNCSTIHDGKLFFSGLVISQAGLVELRIVRPAISAASSTTGQAIPALTLAIYRLEVQVDPIRQQVASCLFLFTSGTCPAVIGDDETVAAADHELRYPITRAFYPVIPPLYLQYIHCGHQQQQVEMADEAAEQDEDADKEASKEQFAASSTSPAALLASQWQVKAYLLPSGHLFAEYRAGIDSLWSGIGLPRQEDTAEEKLGLSAGTLASALSSSSAASSTKRKQLAKLVRRAYYKASLQWHPDRWLGPLDVYKTAVQGIFTMITEAYEHLQLVYFSPAAINNAATAASNQQNNKNKSQGSEEEGASSPDIVILPTATEKAAVEVEAVYS